MNLEIQADSLEIARRELQEKLSAGQVLIRETVVDDGSQKTVAAEAASVEEAIRKAKSKLPALATLGKDEVLRAPTREVREVEGFTEDEARKRSGVSHPQKIDSISLTRAGRSGFLGFGRRPNVYSVTVVQNAKVQITYRPRVRIRADVLTAAEMPSMKATFWENGGPIRREGLYEEQRSALLGLAALARAGDPLAATEITGIIKAATSTLLDIGEFLRSHGYQRQQVAAEILGLAGTADCIGTLKRALQFQERHAGCSQYSNRTSTKHLVEESIHTAIEKLQKDGHTRRPGHAEGITGAQATTYHITEDNLATEPGTLECPKCGKVIDGEIPEMGICICAGCMAVLNIDNYRISE